MVVIGLGKNLLLKSVLGHCGGVCTWYDVDNELDRQILSDFLPRVVPGFLPSSNGGFNTKNFLLRNSHQ